MATDLEELVKKFGGTIEPADVPNPPRVYGRLPSDTPPPDVTTDNGTAKVDYDPTVNPYRELVEKYGGRIETETETEPSTTATGVAGSIVRGLAPIAAGAATGAAIGLPIGGVGAIPGAIAGAGAAALTGLVGDPIVSSINSLFGTKYTLPTDALNDLLTRVGVPQARTQAERIVEAAVRGAGAATPGIAIGEALKAGAKQSGFQSGIGNVLTSQPGLQATSGFFGGGAGQLAKERGAGLTGQFAATVGGGMIPIVPAATKAVIQATAKAVAPTGAGIRDKIEPTLKESVQSTVATVQEKISPQNQQIIKKKIEATPDLIETVNFRISGTQVVPDNQATEAIKQGWKDGTIASIKAASDSDRNAMTKMLNIFKMGEKSEAYRTLKRPADTLGDTVQSRINFLARNNKLSGMAIDRIAKSRLRGQTVDYDPAVNSFLKDLENIGVKVELYPSGVAKANLAGSRIQGDVAGEKLLNTILKRLSKTKPPDALGVHDVKRFIDTQVDYGKRNISNPLTAEAERAVKNLRRNLNLSLGEQFPVYKAANTKYSDTKTALDALQNAAGTKIDFKSPSANKQLGTAMRKLTSNYGTRANLIDALDQANSTSTKYGMKLNDDIVNQLIFVNELDRMFGAAAQTSLKAEVGSAMRTGVEIARGNAAQRAMDLVTEKAMNMRGINKDNAVKAMEELLKRKAGQP